jgi:RNA polymerase sigma-70 factor (ECF subfamily)
VLAAGRSDAAASREALARLYQTYWYPLYTYARRKGYSAQDTEDMIQEFFVQLLQHNWVLHAVPNKGRFRSFLLTALNRFLINQWDKSRRQKRGGHLRHLTLSLGDAESRFFREPLDTCTPEQMFEKQWALAVLEQVLTQLREEYAGREQTALFDALKPSLVGSRQTQPYDRLASELGMTEGSVKVAVHRLRQRYRDRLLKEIAQTVASPDEVESELRHLFRVFARR